MGAAKELSPFEYLLAIERQCIEQFGGLGNDSSDASVSHGLAFRLGEHKYIVPITDVTEVLALSEFTRLPRIENWVVGIANIRGNLITLLDLHELLLKAPSKADMRAKRVLMVQQEGSYFGLFVDSIIGMKSFQSDGGVNEIPEGFKPDFLDHVSAFHSANEEWFAALSVQSVLQDKSFEEIGL